MKAKRGKQYKKLMHQYGLHFGFREPYQVLVDAAALQDAFSFKMNFISLLEKTLHGSVKISKRSIRVVDDIISRHNDVVITQCSRRHLYEAKPKNDVLVDHAKRFELRRCGHHELEQPLSTAKCFKDVIDPKGNRTNKNHLIIATQDEDVRRWLRSIPGVPLIYLKRSVMIMEPISAASEAVCQQQEQIKFDAGLKGERSHNQKRAREEDSQDKDVATDQLEATTSTAEDYIALPSDTDMPPMPQATSITGPPRKRRKVKGPNPLSVKKAKRKPQVPAGKNSSRPVDTQVSSLKSTKPRKRKHTTRGPSLASRIEST